MKEIINKNNRDGIVKSFIYVFLTNLLTLCVGILTSLAVPKFMPIEEYSDYKLFTMYLSYIGLFHFGFIDGIAVKYAGKKIEETGGLYKELTKILVRMETIVTAAILIVVLCVFNDNYRLIFSAVAVDIILHNFLSYCGIIMQITGMFSSYAKIGVVSNILRLLGVIALYYMSRVYIATSLYYIVIYIMCEVVQIAFCIVILRNIFFVGEKGDCREEVNGKGIIDIFKVGVPLLLSGLVGTLILNMDRQFVSAIFTKLDYAAYSLTYSIMNLALTLITSLSLVLYPRMKNLEAEELKRFHNKAMLFIIIASFGCLTFTGVAVRFINWFLPQYSDSADILYVIIPIVPSLAIIQVLSVNYFKTVEKTFLYLKISIVVVIVSFISNCIATFLFKSMSAIAIASVISCMVWMDVCEIYINRSSSEKYVACLYSLIMTAAYYLLFYNRNFFSMEWISSIVYLMVFICGSVIVVKRYSYGKADS